MSHQTEGFMPDPVLMLPLIAVLNAYVWNHFFTA
jgi:hypothetical protein